MSVPYGIDWMGWDVYELEEWEQASEVLECRDEAMDSVGWRALITFDNPMKWSEVCDTASDTGDSASSRSFLCGTFGTRVRVCSFFQILYLRPVVINCSNF